MNRRRAYFAIFLTLAATHPVGAQLGNVTGKTIIHTDGTRTESVNDPNTRQMEQKTFDANNVLIMRRHYQLNEKGLPVMGNVYDGAGNLIARSQSVVDSFGRLQEERLSNLQGEVFQQIIHEYDSKGNAKKPKVINYKVNSPTMRPAVVDFRFQQPGAEPSGASGTGRVRQPVNMDNVPAQPAPPAATPPPPQPEEPKKGFFQKLFKK